ncbi:MAG: baseplate J/gp47 family protein, partial [bacterium]|nr:baseplate J/gp47 family protein [bacterium]
TVIRIVSSISGVTSAVNENFEANDKPVQALYREGSDRETDDALRKRVQLAWQTLGVGGNRAAYEQWALSVPGVRAAQILDDFPFGPGTVGVVVLGVDGMPTSQLLSDVLIYLRQRKPLTSDVRVVGPSKRTVNVSVKVWRLSSADRDRIDTTVSQIVAIHTSKLLLGEGLLVARLLQAILCIDGVYNVHIEQPQSDLICGPTEFLELGTLTVEHFLKGRSYQDTGIITEPVESTNGDEVLALRRENFYA